MGATDTKKSLIVRQFKDKGLFTNELNDKQAIKLLKQAVTDRKKAQYPNVPDYGFTTPNYEDATANGLTKCILDYLNIQDHCHAERISNEGVLRKDKYGQTFRATSSMQNGTADISATILGRSVKIEVKVGRDIQSEAQREYQRQIENARGYYVIARNFNEFMAWFQAKYPKQKGGGYGE